MSRCFWLICIGLLTVAAASWPTLAKAQAGASKPKNICEDKIKLCIGVRSQARPFSYKPRFTSEIITDGTFGPLAREGYTGYIVRICDAVLKEMTLNTGDKDTTLNYSEIGVVDLDADEPTDDSTLNYSEIGVVDLNADEPTDDSTLNYSEIGVVDLNADEPPDVSRLKYLGQRFDILCDPTTISNDRRSDYTVSAPLFLTGVSYITLAGENRSGAAPAACSTNHNLIGVVKGTNGRYAIKALANTNELPSYKEEINSFLNVGNGCTKSLSIYQTYENVKQAAKAFCEGNVPYYVGPSQEFTNTISDFENCFATMHGKYFVNNKVILENRDNQPCHQKYPLVGITVAKNEPTSRTETRIKEARIPSLASDEAEADALDEETSRPLITGGESCSPYKKLVKSFYNHKEAAQAFCKGEVFYYVGDLEIITENAQAVAGCAYENGSQTYTTDRYGIFGKAIEQDKSGKETEDTERRLRVAQFFEILSRKTVFTPSILDAAFESTFNGRKPSEKLADFYESIRGTYPVR